MKNMRNIFTEGDKILSFPFYGIAIHVPNGWKVSEFGYPNRIDLDGLLGHIKIWFKDWTDNDEIIRDKDARKQSYESAICESSDKIICIDTNRSLREYDNIVYLEFTSEKENKTKICYWLSLVYKTREIQIFLSGLYDNELSLRQSFDDILGDLQFSTVTNT